MEERGRNDDDDENATWEGGEGGGDCHLTKECRDLTRISLTAVRREGDGKYEGKKSGEAASRLSARKNLLNRPFVRYVVSVALKTREGRKLSGRMTAQDQPLRLNVISIAVERENRVVTDSSRQNRIFITRDTRVTISTNRTNRREREHEFLAGFFVSFY